MATTLLRQSALRTALRSSAPSTTKRAALASTTFTRGKATLPDLTCMTSTYAHNLGREVRLLM